MKANHTRIILADGHRLFIDSLKLVIERMSPQIRIIDTAQDGFDALKKTLKERPDIILLDIDLPGMEGQDIVKSIRSKSPETKIVILTTNDEFHCIEESLKNGVSAYLLKDIPLSELITMLPLVSDKTAILSCELVPLIFRLEAGSLDEHKKKACPHSLPPVFSKNERKVLGLVIQGFSNREIAEKMYLAEQTVKNYISNIYSKLGVHNRSQAIRRGKSIIP